MYYNNYSLYISSRFWYEIFVVWQYIDGIGSVYTRQYIIREKMKLVLNGKSRVIMSAK